MVDSPNTKILYPNKRSAVWVLIGCSAFVAIGIGMGNSGKWIGYACAVLFGLGIPIALIQFLPGSSYLKLDKSNFTYCALFRKTSLPWAAVEEFFVVVLKQHGILTVHKMVGFNFAASYDRQRIGRRIAKIIALCEGALPDTYGMKADELASLLNSCLNGARLGWKNKTLNDVLDNLYQ